MIMKGPSANKITQLRTAICVARKQTKEKPANHKTNSIHCIDTLLVNSLPLCQACILAKSDGKKVRIS